MSTAANKAVFLSYASQDAAAVQRIAEALRAAGVEVWFDQNELVGGDAWDAKIRGQIAACALFVPVISAATQARTEGYFRLEWKIAAQRTHMIADDAAFLLPVVIDETRDADARVPAEFKAVQWTRLPGGETSTAFSGRVKQLLAAGVATGRADSDPVPAAAGQRPAGTAKKFRSLRYGLAGLGAATAFFVAVRWSGREAAVPREKAPPAAIAESRPTQRALQLRALTGLSRERLGAAEALLAQVLKADPTDAEALGVAAQVDVLMVYRSWDRSDERRQTAGQRAARALALAPGGFESRRAQAMVAAFMVQSPEALQEAEAAYRRLGEERPGDASVLEELGIVLLGRAKPREAAELFTRAGRRLLVANAQAAAGQFRQAREICAAVLAERRSVEALVLKANIDLFGFNDREAARASVSRLTPTELREDDAAGIALRLAVLSADAPGLLKLMEQFPHPFVSILGINYPRRYWTGMAREWLKQHDAARIEWRAALQTIDERLKADPADSDALSWAALLHMCLGDVAATEQALRAYRNYRDLSTGHWDFHYCLPLLRVAGGEDEAIDRLAKTLREPPDGQFNTIVYAWARFSPEFDPLRGKPRFERLLREMRPADALPFEGERAAVPAAVPEKSVAVLAFANTGGDKDNEIFSDGISDEVLNVLAKIPGLKVSARTSAFFFKGKQVPIPEIARQLGVAYIVEGSVRKAGTQVRITAQLIKAADGFQVWGDTFTRELKDIFAVQDEIAGLIAKSLELTLAGRSGPAREIAPEAYQHYLSGRAAVAKAGMADLRQAVTHFERAVAREPAFAAAWVQLAAANTQLGRWGGLPTREAWPAARAAIKRARELDPDSPDVWLALGWILRTADWDWRGAERALRRAMALRPNHADTLSAASVLLFNLGQQEEAFQVARQAAKLDPLNPATQIDLSLMFFFSESWAEAEQAARRALQLSSAGHGYHAVLAWSLIVQKRFAEGEDQLALEHSEVERLNGLGMLALGRGQASVARGHLARLQQLAESEPDRADLQQSIAWLFAGLGEVDRAFAALEKAVASRDPSVSWSRTMWPLRRLYDDPRWVEFLRKVGLADDQLK